MFGTAGAWCVREEQGVNEQGRTGQQKQAHTSRLTLAPFSPSIRLQSKDMRVGAQHTDSECVGRWVRLKAGEGMKRTVAQVQTP